MSSLANVYIKKEMLQKLIDVLDKKGENAITIDFSINDTSNDYGQNVSAYVTQSKEHREAKKPKFYVGNGKVFWTDGKISVAGKKEETHQAVPITNNESHDDLPF